MFFVAYHAGRAGCQPAPADVRVQWRAGVSDGVAAHGSAGTQASGAAAGWFHAGGAIPHQPTIPTTLLDKSDLVLVDAIGTGFSRAADAGAAKKFWGVKGDIGPSSANSSACTSRAMSAGPRRCSFWRELRNHTRSGHSGLSGRASGLRSMGSPCFRRSLSFQTLADNKTQRSALRPADSVVHHDRGLPPQAAT